MGFKSIRVTIFYVGLPKSNATLLLYPGLEPAMLRRLRRESLPVSIGGVSSLAYPNLLGKKVYVVVVVVSELGSRGDH